MLRYFSARACICFTIIAAFIVVYLGDRFYVRTHMTYEAPKGSNHMSFKPGDIFQVVDTLRSGVIGELDLYK